MVGNPEVIPKRGSGKSRHGAIVAPWRSARVPGVYPAVANLQVYSLLPVRRINNLRNVNVAFSSIPTRASRKIPIKTKVFMAAAETSNLFSLK